MPGRARMLTVGVTKCGSLHQRITCCSIRRSSLADSEAGVSDCWHSGSPSMYFKKSLFQLG